MRFSVIVFLLFLTTNAFSQTSDPDSDLIQFSGVVLDGDSLSPIPFANIIEKKSSRGTTSDYYGYFSFVAHKGDSIFFSSIGYKESVFVIPDTLSTQRYSLIQLLVNDTFLLKEHVVYPWPSKEQFKEAFLNLRVPDDDLERAKRNLAQAEMRDRMLNMPMADGSISFKINQQKRNAKLYSAGQYPSYTILNPIAWAQFIQAWKRGDFKKQ